MLDSVLYTIAPVHAVRTKLIIACAPGTGVCPGHSVPRAISAGQVAICILVEISVVGIHVPDAQNPADYLTKLVAKDKTELSVRYAMGLENT